MLENQNLDRIDVDVSLIYDLRKAAMKGCHLKELLSILNKNDKKGGIVYAQYFILSFGVPLPLMKELGGFVSMMSIDELVKLDVVPKIEKAIIEKSDIWSKHIN